jgi:uncharacterized protein YutE (UPF0331/DUF86 family)
VGSKNLNIARLSEKVADIRQSLAVLQEYAGREEGVFLNNPEAVRSARYAFIVMIEAALSISNHLCARLLREAPQSYAESFLRLGDSGYLQEDLAGRLARMAAFRNLLVHGYGKVDDRLMLKIMREDLRDLELFLTAIHQAVDRE